MTENAAENDAGRRAVEMPGNYLVAVAPWPVRMSPFWWAVAEARKCTRVTPPGIGDNNV